MTTNPSGIENVWSRMKRAAGEHASGRRPLRRIEAEALIVRFFKEEHVSPFPPRDIIAFYADELLERSSADR